LSDESRNIGRGASIALLILLLSFMPKCDDQTEVDVAVLSVEHHINSKVVSAGEWTIEIRPTSDSIEKQSSSNDDHYVIVCGEIRVEIAAGELAVNEIPFGKIIGAKVILVDGAKVYVDNHERMSTD